MAGYRRAYTIDEDNLILKWIVKSKSFYNVRGKAFWLDLAESEIFFERSWYSLQNRFEKKILPDIKNPNYTLSKKDKRKIEIAWAQLSDYGNFPNADEEGDLNSGTGSCKKRSNVEDPLRGKQSEIMVDSQCDSNCDGSCKKHENVAEVPPTAKKPK